MRQPTLCVCAAALLLLAAGCKKASNQDDEIRAAVQRHLSQRGNLNLAGFDTEIKQVAYQGDRAQAEVVFHVKNSPGSMQLAYNLVKRDGAWAVVDSKPVGGNITHPELGQGQAGAPGSGSPVSDAVKNFKSQPGAAQGALPPGHPPIDGAAKPEPQKKP